MAARADKANKQKSINLEDYEEEDGKDIHYFNTSLNH